MHSFCAHAIVPVDLGFLQVPAQIPYSQYGGLLGDYDATFIAQPSTRDNTETQKANYN